MTPKQENSLEKTLAVSKSGYPTQFPGFSGGQKDKFHKLRYGVNICGYHLLFGKSVPCETVVNFTIYSIPNMPAWVYGVINLRGSIVPIFKLDELLSEDKKQYKDYHTALIIGPQADAIGLATANLPLAVEIDEMETAKFPTPSRIPAILSNCTQAVYNVAGKTWIEIDLNRFNHFIQNISH